MDMLKIEMLLGNAGGDTLVSVPAELLRQLVSEAREADELGNAIADMVEVGTYDADVTAAYDDGKAEGEANVQGDLDRANDRIDDLEERIEELEAELARASLLA